jgi:hypothetical protein
MLMLMMMLMLMVKAACRSTGCRQRLGSNPTLWKTSEVFLPPFGCTASTGDVVSCKNLRGDGAGRHRAASFAFLEAALNLR